MLQQRLRWSQGGLQVMFRENPLVQKGLSVAQRLMYLSTMWSNLGGFATAVFLVALTAYARTEDRVLALEAGFHAHIAKPVDPPELTALIAGLAPERRD